MSEFATRHHLTRIWRSLSSRTVACRRTRRAARREIQHLAAIDLRKRVGPAVQFARRGLNSGRQPRPVVAAMEPHFDFNARLAVGLKSDVRNSKFGPNGRNFLKCAATRSSLGPFKASSACIPGRAGFVRPDASVPELIPQRKLRCAGGSRPTPRKRRSNQVHGRADRNAGKQNGPIL